MGSRWKRHILVSVAIGGLVATGLTACSSDSAKFIPPKPSAAVLAVTPEAGTKKAPVSTEVGISVTKGKVTEVTMQDEKGKAVEGQLRGDLSSWVPDKPLEYKTTYTATVNAVDGERIPTSAQTSFTTMASPKKRVTATLWNNADYEYGNAMPVMVDFPQEFEVAEKHRATVERRLFVTSEPRQDGVWHWFTGSHLEYRPETFWKPGTEITVRAALEGVPLGGGKYGEKDFTQKVKIDDTVRVIEISDDDKSMVAKKDGKEVKTMPISLGKSSTPSYSGTMTIMEQASNMVFDTTAACGGRVEGDNCYRVPVDWAQRLTWSGQFIHSAPWSVGDQGVRNVSHGCVNASPGDSKWMFDFAKVGDPVIITGTGSDLPYGDGFTAFDMSWEDFVKGSYAADLATDPGSQSKADTDETD